MDTPFPTEPLSIPEFTPEAAPQAPVEESKGPGFLRSLGAIGSTFAGPSGAAALFNLGATALGAPEVFTDKSDREYKGKGEFLESPKDIHVQRLRELQADPETSRQFDERYGQGASARYLNYASGKDVDLLLKNRDDPDAIEAFNALYGPNAAKYYLPIFDPKTAPADKIRAGLDLKRIMLQGQGGEDVIANSRPGQYLGSVVKGAEGAASELAHSVASLTGSDAVDAYAKTLDRPDTRQVDDHIINGAISGVSQFVTGFALLNGLMPGVGAIGQFGKVAQGAASFLRGMSVAGLTDAFAFSPNDPMLGDMAKVIQDKTGYQVMPDALRDYLTVENHDGEADRRLTRAIEGAGLGVGIEVLIGLAKAARYALRGDKEAAKATVDSVADTLEKTDWDKVHNDRQADRLLHEEPEQLGLDLQGGGARPDEQLSFDHTPKFSEADPHVDVGQRMDLPAERNPEQLDWLGQQQGRAAAAPENMEQALRDKWQPADPQLELPLPAGRREFGDAALPGRPGDQLPLDFENGVGRGAPQDVVTRADLTAATEAEHAREAATPGPWQRRTPEETAQVETRLARLTEDEVIRQAVDPTPEPIRDVVEAVRGRPEPLPRDGSDPVRSLVEKIPDFENTSLLEKERVLRPFVDQWLDLVDKHGTDLLESIAKRFTPSEIEKLAPLLKMAAADAKRAADDVAAEVRRLLKEGQGAESERLRQSELAPAQERARTAQEVAQETSSMAGRLLQSLKVTDEILRAPATRAHIDELRANGMSEAEIANIVRQSLDDARVDMKKLADLSAEAKAAREAGDDVKAAALEKELAAETNRVLGEATKANNGWWKIFWQHFGDAKLSLMFYGPKTVLINNVIPNLINMTLRHQAELYGQWRVRMTMNGDFHPFLAAKESMTISASKWYGLRAGYESHLAAMADIAKDGLRSGLTGETKIGAARMAENAHGPQPFTAGYYGLEGTARGTAVNTLGGALHLPFKIMALGDEVLGSVVARSEIAAEASIRHLDAIRERKSVIRDVLKDKTLTAEERTKLRSELDSLNSGKVEIDGKPQTAREYIEDQFTKAFDEKGRLVDDKISTTVDKVLLKDAFESGVGKAIEDLLAKAPATKALVFPIFRTPFRDVQRSFEFLPGFNRIPGWSDFSADLAGKNGLRAQALAKGKAVQGWALMTGLAFKYYNGEMTGPGPSNYEERKRWQDAGWQPNSIKVGATWYDYSSLGVVGAAMKVVSSTLQSVDLVTAKPDAPDWSRGYDNGEDAKKKRGAAAEILRATAMALATGVLDNSMLTGMKNIVQLSQAMNSDNPDDAKAGTVVNKAVAQQASSFVPQLLRNINEVMDPRSVKVFDVVDVYRAATFGKDDLAKDYTFLGTVRSVDNPDKTYMGFLAPIKGKAMSKEQFILQTAKNLEILTGAKLEFQPKAPGSQIGDTRKIQSTTGRGTVADRYAENLHSLRIPSDGPTLEEAIYDLFSKNADPQTRSFAIGQDKSPGKLVEAARDIVERYRKLAWKVTEDQEVASHALNEAKQKEQQLKKNAANPAKDRTVPWRLDQNFSPPGP